MPKSVSNNELLEEVDRLSQEDRRRVLDFARALGGTRPEGTPGRELLRHLGSLPSEEVDRMAEAIEEGCEQMSPDAW